MEHPRPSSELVRGRAALNTPQSTKGQSSNTNEKPVQTEKIADEDIIYGKKRIVHHDIHVIGMRLRGPAEYIDPSISKDDRKTAGKDDKAIEAADERYRAGLREAIEVERKALLSEIKERRKKLNAEHKVLLKDERKNFSEISKNRDKKRDLDVWSRSVLGRLRYRKKLAKEPVKEDDKFSLLGSGW
ncbi:Hypothetical protein D9617_5g069270 [Elsinoe fawcettii]|nr:Hypothetical protein D9617_5g069270 [Elsinoe fawcettii]